MVPRMLDENAGGLLGSWCKKEGIDVHTSCSVEGIADVGDKQVEVSLSDGGKLSAALVITATGVKANIDLLKGTDIDTDEGILVNRRMQTSNADVYAAGDVAQGIDFSTGNQQVQAIQPTAADHARIAALNMSGQGSEHHGTLNMNVLDTVGLVSCSFGLWMGVDGGDSAQLYNPDEFQYINLQFDGDHLVGASSVGKTQHIGVLRGLIETRVHLGEWKQRLMQDPTLVMDAYIGCTQELGYS
jgi:NAD(P)H-nitrite reductase large subunit